MTTPNPGSKDALGQGCTCAVYDNCGGLGRYGNGEQCGWYISGDCPLHAQGTTTWPPTPAT